MNKSLSLAISDNSIINIGATGIDEIEQNIRMIFTTKKGSVYLYRLFGLSQSFIDAPVSTAVTEIQNEIYDAIEKYEPRVNVTSITFTGTDNGSLQPVIKYEIKEGVLL